MMCSRGPCTQHACKDVGELWMLGLVHWRMCTGALAWIRILLTTRDTLVELITLSSLLEYTLYFVECMMSCCSSVSTIHGQSWIMPSCTPSLQGFPFSYLVLEASTSIHCRSRVDCLVLPSSSARFLPEVITAGEDMVQRHPAYLSLSTSLVSFMRLLAHEQYGG